MREYDMGDMKIHFRHLVNDADRITLRAGLVTVFTWRGAAIWKRIPIVCGGCAAQHRLGLAFMLGRVGITASIGEEPHVRCAT